MIIRSTGFETLAEAEAESMAICSEAVTCLTASNVWGQAGRRMEDNMSRRVDEFHAKCNMFYLMATDDAVREQWRTLNNRTYDLLAKLVDGQRDARAEKVRISRPKKFYN